MNDLCNIPRPTTPNIRCLLIREHDGAHQSHATRWSEAEPMTVETEAEYLAMGVGDDPNRIYPGAHSLDKDCWCHYWQFTGGPYTDERDQDFRYAVVSDKAGFAPAANYAQALEILYSYRKNSDPLGNVRLVRTKRHLAWVDCPEDEPIMDEPWGVESTDAHGNLRLHTYSTRMIAINAIDGRSARGEFGLRLVWLGGDEDSSTYKPTEGYNPPEENDRHGYAGPR